MATLKTLLPAPVVLLANDGRLDPDKVDRYLEIEVPTSASLVPFARCTLRIPDTNPQCTDDTWNNPDQLSEGRDGESLWFYLAKNVVEALRGTIATFSYDIVSHAEDGTEPADVPVKSASTTLIVGKLESLPRPKIADLDQGVVDSTLPRLLVTVPESVASLTNAMVTVTLRADPLALARELSQVLNVMPPVSSKDVTQETKGIVDDLEALPFAFRGYPATHHDHEVDASYEIVLPNGTTLASESVTFHIGTPLGLNEPLIEEAIDGVLDIDSFAGDAHITTEPNERVTAGLFYWAYIASEGDGEPTLYPLAVASAVTQDEVDGGLRISITREILNLLPAASTLRVQIAINLAGTDDPFDTVDFPASTYTVAVAEAISWDLDDLNPAQIPPIHVGQTMSFPLMDIVFVAARIAPETNRIAVEQFAYSSPGYYSGVVLYIGGVTGTATDNVVRIEFKRRWGKVRFALTSVDAPLRVTWHAASGETVGQTIPGGSPTAGHEARCELEGIEAVVIEPKDGIRLDCFEFKG